MSDHLTPEVFTALADGELAADDLRAARVHLDRCLECAKLAIDEWLMKAAVAKAGQRYEAQAAFRDRMSALIARETSKADRQTSTANQKPSNKNRDWNAFAGWATAAVMLLAFGAWGILAYRAHSFDAVNNEQTAMIAEACDLHIAMLAANQAPQVVSSDRHTVKPWFQGKLPFSFNIPESLPAGMSLDGANLAYLHNLPVAQLLFSIGRHRASVFIEEKAGAGPESQIKTFHSGFQVIEFSTGDLEVISVSDVDPARLDALATGLREAQLHP